MAMEMNGITLLNMLSRAMFMEEGPHTLETELDKKLAMSVHMEGYNRFAGLSSKVKDGSLFQFRMSSVPVHCAPSVALEGLRPISLSELKLDKVHRGRVLFGRLCVDAFIVTGVMTVLADETNPAMGVRVSLYNVALSNGSFSAVQKLFPKGTRVAVKEPFLKRCQDGYIGLRVDNPSNIQKVGEKILRSPLEDRAREQLRLQLVGDADELRCRGNSMFGKGDWRGAIECYTQCIMAMEGKESTSACVLAYSNRAEAWMKLENWHQALQDCEHALAMDPTHVKTLFRRGRSLHGLKRYKEACSCLESLLAEHPDLQEVPTFLNASRKALRDHRTGYDVLVESFLLGKTPPSAKCDDFIGPVVVKRSERCGRGLFATSHVMPGDLLLVSNAMAVCEQEESNSVGLSLDVQSKRINSTSQEDLVTKLANLGLQSPALLRQLYALSSSANSKDMPVPSMDLLCGFCEGEGEDGGTELDIVCIRDIVRLNSFEASESNCQSSHVDTLRMHGYALSTGLWLLPSFINHSCLPNANKVIVRETMLIYASAEVLPGEEITISYFNPFLPLNMRQDACQHWEFQCQCKRCALEKSVQHRLEAINSQFCVLFNEANRKLFVSMRSDGDSLALADQLYQAFKRAKKKIKILPNLAAGDVNMLLASYCGGFLAKWFLTWQPRKPINCSDMEAAMEVMRAMVSCQPGHTCTLLVVARIGCSARPNSVGKQGKGLARLEAACAMDLGEEALKDCFFAFGRLKPRVLGQVLDRHIRVFPVSLFSAA